MHILFFADQICPNDCSLPLGKCNLVTGMCDCVDGFIGEDCAGNNVTEFISKHSYSFLSNFHFIKIIPFLSDYDGEDSDFIVEYTDKPGRKFFSLGKLSYLFKLFIYRHFDMIHFLCIDIFKSIHFFLHYSRS